MNIFKKFALLFFFLSTAISVLLVKADSSASCIASPNPHCLLTEVIQLQQNVTSLSLQISELKTLLQFDFSAISGLLMAEVARAENSEAVLSSNLQSEISRAESAESILSNRISAESSRAQGTETSLTINLNTESSRAQAVETGLAGNLNQETVRAEGVEALLASNLQTESSRAQAVETGLAGNLNQETVRAEGVEALLASNLQTESSRAQAAETNLAISLESEVARAEGVESSETTRAQAAESILTGAVTDEVARAQSSEDDITSSFLSHIAASTTAEGSKLLAETQRATAAESQITIMIQTEINNRQSGDQVTLSAANSYALLMDVMDCQSECPNFRFANGTGVCINSVCTLVCNTNWANCDGINSNGCETSLITTNNCGACGSVCNLANSVSQCDSGSCAISSCNTGYGNCDSITANGCEINLLTDAVNCGTCGTSCGLNTCTSGVCSVGCSNVNEVSFNGRCFYFDGTTGSCLFGTNPGRGFNADIAAILQANPSAFVGKNYRSQVSSNCCIWTADTFENYGFASHCNAPGPFSLSDPSPGAVGCTSQQNHYSGQLTFCAYHS
jgi:hypothetical protein